MFEEVEDRVPLLDYSRRDGDSKIVSDVFYGPTRGLNNLTIRGQ